MKKELKINCLHCAKMCEGRVKLFINYEYRIAIHTSTLYVYEWKADATTIRVVSFDVCLCVPLRLLPIRVILRSKQNLQ